MLDYNIYQNEDFLRVLEDVYAIEKVNVFENKEFCGLTTFYRSKKKKSDLFNMPFNFYYSPVISPEIEGEYFNSLNGYSKKNNINIIIKSLREYNQKHIIQNFNSILSISKFKSHEEYFKSLRKNFRQNIRTYYNKLPDDIELKMLDTLDEVKSFYILLSELYVDKHKMVFQPFELYENLFEKKMLKIFSYKKEDKILSAVVVIEDDKFVHYNWGVTDTNYYKYSLNTLLINEMIKYYFNKEVTYFDFGATPKSDNKLLYFKSRWGCEHMPVYEYYTLSEPNQIDLNNSYHFIRFVYSKFPKSFLRWLMPKIIPWLVC